jgi:hypothetical protein
MAESGGALEFTVASTSVVDLVCSINVVMASSMVDSGVTKNDTDPGNVRRIGHKELTEEGTLRNFRILVDLSPGIHGIHTKFQWVELRA